MLLPFVVVLALLVLVPTLLWGFPGVWAFTAVVPALIGAATIRHVRMPREDRAAGGPGSAPAGPSVGPGAAPAGPSVGPGAAPAGPSVGPVLRPGVIVLGGLFTLVSGAASLIFMWASAAPQDIVIVAETQIEASPDRVWAVIVDLPQRKTWSPWMADAEPIGRGGAILVGSQFRAKLALERGYPVQAELEVTAFEPEVRFAWRVKPLAGSQLADITESVTLSRVGDVLTNVRYQLSYQVPTVLGRVGERIAVRGSVERLAETTASLLKQKVLAPQ